MRRSLAVLLWIVAGLLASFLGTLAALVGTGPGRTLVLGAARAAAAGALGGRIEIGTAGGPLLTGLQLTDVKLYDPDSTLVADLPRVDFTYRIFDLLAGRIILRDVTLDHPTVNLLQHKNGRLDIEELLHLGEHRGGPATTPPLVLLRDVHIVGGTVLLRLQARPTPGDSSAEIEETSADGRRRVRRFQSVNARVASLRLSSPTEHGIRIDVDSLATRISDPPVEVRDMAGRVTIAGDSLRADLDRVGLPGTKATLAGWIHWPHGRLVYDLDVHADSATLADIRFIDPRFPAGAVDVGRVRVRSHGPELLEVRLDPLDLTYHGGKLTGRVTALSRTDQGVVAIQGGDLTAENFDLGFALTFLDSLPFMGRLTGHTTVDGEIGQLALDVDWMFRDSLVPGWPVSRVRGSGVVGLDRPVGLAFKPFTVAAATVSLATARRIVPSVPLRGTMEMAGTLMGPLRNVRFDGTLRQREGDAPATLVHGGVRFDSRGDTLGVAVDLTADTLSFDGLKGSVPGIPFRGSVGGTIHLTGPVTALETHVDLGSEAGGRLRADGTLGLAAERTVARGVTLTATDLDLGTWIAGAPPSSISASVTTTFVRDSGRGPEGSLAARIGPSVVAGAPLDSGAIGMRFADQRMYVDSLDLYQPGLATTGVGDLGWARPARGSLVVDVRGDSLNSLDSLVTWATGTALAADGTRQPLEGSARISATLSGALDSLAVTVRASIEALRGRGVRIADALARFDLVPGPTVGFTAEATADSVAVAAERFSAIRTTARGTLDSLTWYLRSALGDLATVEAGGRLARADTMTTVGVDSLAVRVPDGRWLLDAPVTVAVGDSVLRLGRLGLTRAGGGKVTAQGDIPARGPVQANIQVEGVPLTGIYALLERDTAGVAGNLTATLGLAGTRTAPTYHGSFAFSNASFGEFRTPYVDGTVAYEGRRLDGTVHLWRSGQQILDVTAHLPLDLSLEPVAHRQLPDTLAVRATADSVDLSALEAVTPALQAVRGFVWADLGMRGTWDRPQLEGTVRIDSAGATIPALGVRYDQLSGRFRLAGDTISVESLSARSGGGTAKVAGFVRLDHLTKPMLGLTITADRFKALEVRNYLSVTASGQLALTGPVFGATLTGRGTVTNGVLYFADLVNKRVVNLDSPDPWIASLIDTSITDLIRRERLGPAFQSVFLDSLAIQGLDLTMGSDVWLRSSEANIQLTGAVTLNKRLRNYLISGTLQTPRGTYRLVVGPVTREFVVSQGTVRYFGTPDLDAALSITAKHVVHPQACAATGPTACPSTPQTDIPVVATIGGTLLVPKLSLSVENQDLSQTEIISYLLFGQSTFADANRSAVLSGAVANIVSGEVERTVVSDLGIPIDYFEFRPGDPADPLSGAQLAAGWQIGPKTFLVLNAGFCPYAPIALGNTLGASLQFRLNSEFRTEASFEPAQACTPLASTLYPGSVIRQLGLDLFWERRY